MTKQNKILLAIVAAAAASMAFWFLALTPKREEAAALETQIGTLQAEFQQAQASLVSYRRARDAYPATYARVTRLGKAVPADDDVRSLLVQLNDAARRSKVDFRTISVGGGSGGGGAAAKAAAGSPPPPGAVADSAGFARMPFEFSFTGDFFELSGFMGRLERFVRVENEQLSVTGRLLQLESVELAPTEGGFPRLEATVRASTYVVPVTPAVAGATSSAPPAAGAPGGAPGVPTAPTTTATATGVLR